MAFVGSPDLWADFFPDDLIPDILNMVVDVWSNFVKPRSHEHEVHITKRFRSSLEQYKDLKMLPVRIDREVPVDNLDTAKELGRIDLRLTYGYRSDVYFAFECKRLNVINNNRTRSLATEYVIDGMMRFVGLNPQYANNLTQGGMIGYVMSGKTSTAIQSVNTSIIKHSVDLQMKSRIELNTSSKISKEFVKESLHYPHCKEFILHHIFLRI